MSAADLRPLLERMRTRAGFTAALATALPVAGLAWGLTELLRHFVLHTPFSAAALTLPVAIVTAVAAAAAVWIRRPSLTDVARAADGRLGLHASVVTAWQFRDATDAFATRTSARAVEGLRQAQPHTVYPWRMSRPGVACLLVGLAGGLAGLVDPGAGVSTVPDASVAVTSGSPDGVARPSTENRSATRAQTAASAPTPTTPPPSAGQPLAPRADPRGNAPERSPAPAGVRTGTETQGALTTGRDGSGRTTAAPGGGRAGGSGQSGVGERPSSDAASSAPRAPSSGADAVHAAGRERVPMNRRAYVRRYLLSLAEPR